MTNPDPCRFCASPKAAFAATASDFTATVRVGLERRTETFSGPWPACGSCAQLVRARDWRSLVGRVILAGRERPEARPPTPRGLERGYLTDLFTALGAHLGAETVMRKGAP